MTELSSLGGDGAMGYEGLSGSVRSDGTVVTIAEARTPTSTIPAGASGRHHAPVLALAAAAAWGRAIRSTSRVAVVALVLSLLASPLQPASADDVEQRIVEFWKRVDALRPSDHLTSTDLGQWALNVIERDPGAGLTVADVRSSTAAMQDALDRASAGIPPGVPKKADVEDRVAQFWARVNVLLPSDLITASDLGQWALNVTDRDPSRRIRVDDFRAATAGMQSAFDRARTPQSIRYAGCPTKFPALPGGGTLFFGCNGQTVLRVGAAGVIERTATPSKGSVGLDVSTDFSLLAESESSTSCSPTCETYHRLYLRSAATGSRILLPGLPDPPVVTNARFSPDTRLLAFTSYTRLEGTTALCCPRMWVATLGSGTAQEVALSPYKVAEQPRWSPSGASIAFICDYYNVCVVGSDGRNLRTVHSYQGSGSNLQELALGLAWQTDRRLVVLLGSSPVDLSKIAFAVIDVVSGQRTVVGPIVDKPIITIECLAPSPDGVGILYSRYAGTSAFVGTRDVRFLSLQTGTDVQWVSAGEITHPNNGPCPLRWN